jgi:hypothetical protein
MDKYIYIIAGISMYIRGYTGMMRSVNIDSISSVVDIKPKLLCSLSSRLFFKIGLTR